MKPDTIVEEIKSKIDIVSLIAEHIDLKRSGQNYKGLCPFHSEKTPSFMVNPSKQIFHCFGCGKGGDVFSFIMEYEGMNFQEAITYLSDKAGIRIEDYRSESKANRSLKEDLYAINREALAFFKDNMRPSRQTMAYLKERGLADETVERFSLGYSRQERNALFTHLTKRKFPPEHIKASGLVYFGDREPFDFFRDRLMFPLLDLQDRVIAFGGRIMTSSGSSPKYLNSPESLIFKKGEACYGLNHAKSAISKKGYSIIVEGYMDALLCHQYGFDTTVAPLGTALTAGHLKKLRRFSDKLLLVFDGDAAGVSATKRALELVYAEGMAAKVLPLPQGEDPDTFLRKYGSEQFRTRMGSALTPVGFLLRASGKNRIDGVKALLRLLASCPDSLMREEALRELADKSGMNETALREELKDIRQSPSRQGRHQAGGGPGAPAQEGTSGPAEMSREERMLLLALLSAPDRAVPVLDRVPLDSRGSGFARGLFEKIKTAFVPGAADGLSTERLLALCNGEEKRLVTQLSVSPEIDEENVEVVIEECLRKIAVKDLEKQIRSAGEAGDVERLQSLLLQKRKKLSKNSGSLSR
ncbi:MAG: DNA primase [Alphaproteobacteria bacterium]|uniref:DNA primase n=1 Tax=Candidatus Nitrobium versatile TaxID=2884831 RepID=A0A953LWP0_9BACT|nr:DNA primase [Candidatus Nitrobium versatile]